MTAQPGRIASNRMDAEHQNRHRDGRQRGGNPGNPVSARLVRATGTLSLTLTGKICNVELM